MTRSDDLYSLPKNLPIPVDDGVCDHLPGMALPSIALPATDGSLIDLATLSGTTVLFIYPRTGLPDVDSPPGWDEIAGLRGCTPQACGYRDSYQRFLELGVRVFGLSSQTSDYQREMTERLYLPFPVLSDAGLRLALALKLPTVAIAGEIVIQRTTLVVADRVIRKVFYPVFPPDQNADRVLEWLQANPVGDRL